MLTDDPPRIHINVPIVHLWDLKKMRCPTCQKDRYIWGWFQEWYGWTQTCLRCGERFSDGERETRPFERGWRKRSVHAALAHARRVMPTSPRIGGQGGGG